MSWPRPTWAGSRSRRPCSSGAIRKGTLANGLVPVFAGSAFKNKGVQRLLDGIVDYLPSPLDLPAVEGELPSGRGRASRQPDPKAPFTALAFKIASDAFAGKLTFFRVYSGTLKAGEMALNASTGKKERMGRLLRMHANKREEVPQATAGEIVAAVGLKSVRTGDTLTDVAHPLVLESMDFPEPVIDIAIEPKTKADEEKLKLALERLAEEDPTFQVRVDKETGQTLIAGMGELHLEILRDRMVREFGVAANVGKPQVVYKESVAAPRRGRAPLPAPARRQGRLRPRQAGDRARGPGRRFPVRERGRPGRAAGRVRGAPSKAPRGPR